MRELSRGGSLVAATIAALHSRANNDNKPLTKSHVRQAAIRNTKESVVDHRRSSGGASSDRPVSTASEASERDTASIQSSEEPGPRDSGESDSADEVTVKCTSWTDGNCPPRADSSDTASTTSSSDEDSGGRDYVPQEEPNYRTLTPNRCIDTRCNDDFKWMPTTEIVDDITDHKHSEARDEYPTNSLDRRRKTSDRSDRDRKTRSSMSSKPPTHPSSVRASPRPRRSRVEESPSDLQRRWNSYEHFRWPPEGGWWPPMCWCHGPPPPPPCCMHDRGWPSHPSLPPSSVHSHKNDAEDRVRRLEADKESLQLQVQVLSEQISAQGEKMNDLERALHDARQRLDDAEQRLQKEMLQRSSLETQKLELLSKLSEMRLRVVERGVLERSPPPETSTPVARPAPPRTPPANYGRQIERNTLMYSSLPRSSLMTSLAGKPHGQVAGKGHSVPNLAEREENCRGSPSPLGREGRLEGALVRGPLRHTTPRLRDHVHLPQWQSIDIRQWDSDTTCSWLESLHLEMYIPAMKSWLSSSPDARGILATATPNTIEKELAIKHPMHKKKIVLAVTDLMGSDPDPYLSPAGALDTVWVVRWLDDVGVAGARGAATDVGLDGRGLHRLTHLDLYTHLHVTQAIHAHSIRRGIQVLRDNNFNPDTMVRRAAEGSDSTSEDIARWSTHRVMQWLNEIDLAEYAPNLRGAGVHGGLMLLEPRFTAELLAALLNIPANKTLLRRHLTQRFNDLLGRDVIQQKRNAEQTLGYQPLTVTTKYKVPKKSQFSLKRKKSKGESDYSDLVCPLNDDGSGDVYSLTTTRAEVASAVESGVSLPRDVTSLPQTPSSPFERIT